jgi:SAM-dependent methyltransferase
MFFKKYKPLDYWTKRGKIYKDKFIRDDNAVREENALIDYLKKIQFETVLEYGCGFGRITKLLLDNFKISQYTAFDLSRIKLTMRKNYVIIMMYILKYLQFIIILI